MRTPEPYRYRFLRWSISALGLLSLVAPDLYGQQKFIVVVGHSEQLISDGNPAEYETEGAEWTINLYKNGKPATGPDYWGSVSETTYEKVTGRLAFFQKMEESWDAFFKTGRSELTFFNPGVPVLKLRVVETLLRDDKQREWIEKLSKLYEKINSYQKDLEEFKSNYAKVEDFMNPGPEPNSSFARELREDKEKAKRLFKAALENFKDYTKLLQKSAIRINELRKTLNGLLDRTMENDVIAGIAEIEGDFSQINHSASQIQSFLNQFIDLVGTPGNPRFNLTFTNPDAVDLDLYVQDPLGNVIWFRNATPRTGGGKLDVDCNCSACPQGPSENIFWKIGKNPPPPGSYYYWVSVYETCNSRSGVPSQYTIRVVVGTKIVQHQTGFLMSGSSQKWRLDIP